MPVSTYAYTDIVRSEGIPVTRAAAVLPQSTTTTYFTVTGAVEVLSLVGTNVTSTTAESGLSYQFTPTGGTSGAICTSAVTLNMPTSSLYIVQGPTDAGATTAAALVSGTAGAAGNTLGGRRTIVLRTGALRAVTTANDTAGTWSWVLKYRPLTAGASVTSA